MDALEVIGRIGLAVCLCGYAVLVAWVWGWDKRKDRRERREGKQRKEGKQWSNRNSSRSQ